MFEIKSHVELHLIRHETVHKEVQDWLETQMRQAVRAWLRAIISKIPRYTGTSRQTFRPVAAFIKNVAVGPGRSYGNLSNAKRKKSTVIAGKRYKTDGSVAYSDYSWDKVQDGIKFTFVEELPYVVWNSVFPAPQWIKLPSNPPWGAFDAGEKAFLKYTQEVMPTRQVFKKAFQKVVING